MENFSEKTITNSKLNWVVLSFNIEWGALTEWASTKIEIENEWKEKIIGLHPGLADFEKPREPSYLAGSYKYNS